MFKGATENTENMDSRVPTPLFPAEAGTQAFSEARGRGEAVRDVTTNLTNRTNRRS